MRKSNISRRNHPYRGLIILTAIGVLLFGCLTLALMAYALRPEINELLALTTPTSAATSAPPCLEPVLVLGSTNYRIEPLLFEEGGPVQVPAGTPGIVYRFESSESGDVYALSPTRENLAAATAVRPGDPIDIVWADCGHENYISNSVQQVDRDISDLLGEHYPGITVFVPAEEGSQALLIRGDLRSASPGSGAPGSGIAGGARAAFQYVYTSISEDGETLFISTSILNTGGDVLVLQEGDFSLTTAANENLAPLNIEPVPPIEVQPGAEMGIHVSFPNPEGDTAVLNVQSLKASVEPGAGE